MANPNCNNCAEDPTNYGRLAYLMINELKQQMDEIIQHLHGKSQTMDIDAAAAYLNVPKTTLYKKVSRKEVASCRTGKRLCFQQRDLDAYLSTVRRAADRELR